ncbi:SGNH/GDSL hydrolase family protein [Weissella paramesenteroides]|uniref:SGNH/GDSL hydrolase family protein n=1 Tax=Weissella paramesenteroides TaxID=1249 RepID=UPI003857AA60
MDKLITNLDTNLGAVLREQLDTNFQKIQNGVDGQSDYLNKQIEKMLGDVPLQDKNEVTQARIDANGKQYQTMKTRMDIDQTTAETALTEERDTSAEVQRARIGSIGTAYPTLKARIDDQETELMNNINNKLSQISAAPETFTDLAALKSTYPNGRIGLFVTVDNGHKYIWVNDQWVDAGVYQAVGILDHSIDSDKLNEGTQNLGISTGVYFPLTKGTVINNKLEDTTPYIGHLQYPLNITIENANPDYLYLLLQLQHDTESNSYGATFGYVKKTNDHTFDATKVVTLNVNTFDSEMPFVDEYGHVTKRYVFDELVITITYNVPKDGEKARITFADVKQSLYFDACIIDPSCYHYNLKSKGMDKNYNVDYPLVNYKASYVAKDSTPQVPHRKALRDIKIINPAPNTSYLIRGIFDGLGGKYGVQIATAPRIDGVSFDKDKVTILNDTLSDTPMPIDNDGNSRYSIKSGNTIISVVYNTSDMGLYKGTKLYYYDAGFFYDLALISESTFIEFPMALSNEGDKKFDKPAWLGDSITALNDKASVHYHEILAEEWGSSVSTNLGIGGSTIGNTSFPMSVRYTDIPADSDFISVFGGVNDYGKNQPLGQYGDTTNETFYGALHVLLSGLQSQFPTIPKLFVSPMHIGDKFGGSFTSTVNNLGLTQDDYEEAIVKMTRKFGVPHLSLFSDMGVTFAVAEQGTYYSADTLHPNNNGQALIADKIINFLK